METVNEEICCASGLRCDGGWPFSEPLFAHLEKDDKCSIQLPSCGWGSPDQWETCSRYCKLQLAHSLI